MQAIWGQQLPSAPKAPNSPLLITAYTNEKEIRVHCILEAKPGFPKKEPCINYTI